MVHIMNMLTCYFLLHLYKLSIVMSDATTIVHINPGDEALLNCSEYSFIIIRTVSVQNNSNITKCESNQCNLTSDDHDLINECEGSRSCYIDGSLLTSACLWQNLHFDISYTCQPEERYLYDGCYVDDTYRVLDEDYKDNDEMSAEICFRICTESQNWKEHVYFGTQYAKECYCGNGTELGHEPYVKKETECTIPCFQHEGETCGGNYRMSVYRMTKRHYNYSCLDMYQDHAIKGCATNHLQIESLCIKFDDSLENGNRGCSDMGNKLYDFCRRQHPNRKCDFNMKNFIKATDENQPSRNISIEYLCEERTSANNVTRMNSVDKPSPSIPAVIVPVLVVVIAAALIFIIIFYRRRKRAKNSNSSENRQKHFKTGSINSSVNKTGTTDINIPAIYENINDNKTINHEAHKQEGNYDTLSTNRKSDEHMNASTEQELTELDLSQYQSLTNPPESDIHTYASTEPDLSQYTSLTNPVDIHAYASIDSIQ